MTAVVSVAQMSHDEAERITEQIVGRIDSISENYEVVMMLMRDALARDAHSVLGYASPGAYIKDRFGNALQALGASIRREFVHELSDAGLSTRAIAPVFGVSDITVRRDIAAVGATHVAPERSAPDSPEPVDPTAWTPDASVNLDTGEVTEPTVTEHTRTEKTKTTHGLDGKEYNRKPATPRRRSLVDDAYRANTELWKAIERVRTIRADDRFTRNKADILAALQPGADLAIEVLEDLFK